MKPFIFAALFFALSSASFAQANSETAFEKLQASYAAANQPIDSTIALKRIASIKSCAGANASAPDQMSRMIIPFKAVHTTESFGPDFPSQTYIGIGFEESKGLMSTVDQKFFSTYKVSSSKTTLELATKMYFQDSDCSQDGDCYQYTDSSPIKVNLRLNEKYLLYSFESSYAYCW